MLLKSSTLLSNHGFFTRNGGVSEGVFASLNCGRGSGDDLAKVNQNREIVREKLGAKVLVTAKQCHSDVAIIVNGETDTEADAVVTNTKGVAVAVLTADCCPVLFEDRKAGVIAAAHAGWRGARFGIIGSTIHTMRNMGAHDITAVIGPTIHQKSYEVGQEFFDVFAAENVSNHKFFVRGKQEGKYMFSLPEYVEYQLIKNDIEKIEVLDEDTLSQPDKFFSFRRSTLAGEKQYGRLISAICL